MIHPPLELELFKRKELGQGYYYLSADVGDYEITIEPHLTAGFTVGIYANADPLLSVKKRAVWKYNHPTNPPYLDIEQKLLNRALAIAQYFYEYYQLQDKSAVPPNVTGKLLEKDNLI